MTIFKAIRDKGPVDPGKGGIVKHVDDITFSGLLAAKMHEEAAEIARDPNDINEYADLLEVMEELASRHGISLVQIRAAQLAKKLERGGFSENRTYRGPHPPMGKVKVGWGGLFTGRAPATEAPCAHGWRDTDYCPVCNH